MDNLQKAFELADRLAKQECVPSRERAYFRTIANMIREGRGDNLWQLACTECEWMALARTHSVHEEARLHPHATVCRLVADPTEFQDVEIG